MEALYKAEIDASYSYPGYLSIINIWCKSWTHTAKLLLIAVLLQIEKPVMYASMHVSIMVIENLPEKKIQCKCRCTLDSVTTITTRSSYQIIKFD